MRPAVVHPETERGRSDLSERVSASGGRRPLVRPLLALLVGVAMAVGSPVALGAHASPSAAPSTLGPTLQAGATVGSAVTISGTLTGTSNTGDLLAGAIAFSHGAKALDFCGTAAVPDLIGGSCDAAAGGAFSMTIDLYYANWETATWTVTDTVLAETGTATGTFWASTNLTLSAYQGVVGTAVAIQSTAMDTARTISACTWNGASLAADGCTLGAADEAGNTGNSTNGFDVPASPLGRYNVTYADSGGATSWSSFYVVPWLTLSTASGDVGSTVDVAATGFDATTPFEVIWNPGAHQRVVASGTTLADGSSPAATSFLVPWVLGGSYSVEFLDGDGASVTLSFLVLAHLTTVAPTSGQVNSTFVVSGNGFEAGLTTLAWDLPIAPDYAVLGTATSVNGTITFRGTVPPSGHGGHTVAASAIQNPFCAGGANACIGFDTTSSLNLTPTTNLPGSDVGGSLGQGLTPGGSAFLIWDPGLPTQQFLFPTSTPLNLDGSVAFPVWTIPTTATAGPHTVEVQDSDALTATATLIVGPYVELAGASGPVNSTLNLTGFAFGVGQTVNVFWQGISVPLATIHVSAASGGSLGNFTAPVLVPADPAGAYHLWVNGTGISSGAVFTITRSVRLNASHGPVGTPVRVLAQGMEAHQNATVLFDGGATAAQAPTNARGSASISYTIPLAPAGVHTVSAEDPALVLSNSTPFRVTSHITPSAVAGYEGTSLAVQGTGFAAGSEVVLYWDGVPVPQSGTLSTGVGSAFWNFSLPASAGLGNLSAVDQAFNAAPAVNVTVWGLAVPVPLAPANGALVNRSTVSLSWLPVPQANVSYAIELSNRSSFTDGTTLSSGLGGTALTVGPLADGWWYWRVEASTAAPGTAGWSSTESFLVDTTPPVASLAALPPFETSLSFPVGWSAYDPGPNASGLAGVDLYWSNDSGASWQTIPGGLATFSPTTVTVPGPGRYLFSIEGVDRAGNRQAFPGAETSTVVEVSGPLTSATVSGNLSSYAPQGFPWYAGPVVVALSAPSTVSGPSTTYLRTSPTAAWSVYTGPLDFGASGSYTVEYFSRDPAGNVGPWGNTSFAIDTDDITASFATVPLTVIDGTSTLRVSLSDPSGIVAAYLSIDGAPAVPMSVASSTGSSGAVWVATYSVNTNALGNGLHSFSVRAVNELGQSMSFQEVLKVNNASNAAAVLLVGLVLVLVAGVVVLVLGRRRSAPAAAAPRPPSRPATPKPSGWRATSKPWEESEPSSGAEMPVEEGEGAPSARPSGFSSFRPPASSPLAPANGSGGPSGSNPILDRDTVAPSPFPSPPTPRPAMAPASAGSPETRAPATPEEAPEPGAEGSSTESSPSDTGASGSGASPSGTEEDAESSEPGGDPPAEDA